VAVDRPIRFGLIAGVGIGTVGLAAEWAWSHAWMPLPWPVELLPEAAILGFAMAVAGAVLGAWIGRHLAVERLPAIPRLRFAAVAAAAVVAIGVGYALVKPPNEGVSATVALTDVAPAPERAVSATIRLDPPDAADDAEWLTATAWQGDGLVVDRLERVGPGEYRTTEPIPVHDNWKALIRLHDGSSLTAIPVYLPSDPAIPAEEVPATASFERPFVPDQEILQREQKDTAGWLTGAAMALVAAIALSLLVLLAWGLHRLSVTRERADDATAATEPARAPEPAGRGRLDPAGGHA